MRLSPSDLIPADQKVVVPFLDRWGETWFALRVVDCVDGLISVHPSATEAEAARLGRPALCVEPLVFLGSV